MYCFSLIRRNVGVSLAVCGWLNRMENLHGGKREGGDDEMAAESSVSSIGVDDSE